jgi:hypothetical protein
MKRECDIIHGRKYVPIYKSLRYTNNCMCISKKRKVGVGLLQKKERYKMKHKINTHILLRPVMLITIPVNTIVFPAGWTWRLGWYVAAHVFHRQFRFLVIIILSWMTDEYGTFCGMRTHRGFRRTRREPNPVPLYLPQIPYNLASDLTQAAAVGSRQLISWAEVRPKSTD